MSLIRQPRPWAAFLWRIACAPLFGVTMTVPLSGCGGGADRPAVVAAAGPEIVSDAHASRGQVTPVSTQRVSFYAASRFAEQASFGPTPALVAELQAKGFERWINEQFALPFAPIDVRPVEAVYNVGPNQSPGSLINAYHEREFARLAVAGTDPLRLRVMWSLSQFVVAGTTKGEAPGWVTWINLLYRHGLGNYRDLLREASVNPYMGHYLDNDQNRPKSAECQHCAPNENFARELMQLFTIGVIKLNPNGTPVRDSRGRFIETYTQRDVEEMARVLTGWQHDPVPENRPPRNWANWTKPMVPSTWPPERDAGAKSVMGTSFPAGQSTTKDLDDAVALLMAHPNIAPFVSLRLIQHLVKSDPSPEYVARVAAAFRNNGSGVAGDMKAVVKAILLDAEARRGDNPAGALASDGKVREPVLHSLALWRGMGCRTAPARNWNVDEPAFTGSQSPFRPESVFSFYAPTDRAPGSNLLAPEQKLLTANDTRDRLALTTWPVKYAGNGTRSYELFSAAGCPLEQWRTAFAQSPGAFNDLLSSRFFRGAMPPTLRSNIEQIMKEVWPPWDRNDPTEGALRMMGFALATPYYGVIK